MVGFGERGLEVTRAGRVESDDCVLRILFGDAMGIFGGFNLLRSQF